MKFTVFVFLVCIVAARGWFFNKEKCYNPFGCFDNKWPYENSDDVPVSPSKVGLRLLLNNRINPDLTKPDYLSSTNTATITNSRFDKNLNVVVIIHGFHGSVTDDWVSELATEILAADDVNIICVDWKDGAKTINYEQATANTRLVGKMVAKLLTNIHNMAGTAYNRMHIIGHSLGAHVAGYAGRFSPKLVGRITGMDPAGPRFQGYDPLVHLDSSDALFIDVIHSDDDAIIEMGFGTGQVMGDLDFYPNGGENQPGCSKKFLDYLKNLISFDFGELTDQVACSHMRAIHYYISSIRQCSYTGYQCASYANYLSGNCYTTKAAMGYWASPTAEWGKYYLQTSSTKPFC